MKKKDILHEGSVNHWLSTFTVGEVRWKETTLDRYAADQRVLNYAKTRRPSWMLDWEFTSAFFTAVSTSKAGDIHYIIRVERTK